MTFMIADRQDNDRAGDWHQHEDTRVGCDPGEESYISINP